MASDLESRLLNAENELVNIQAAHEREVAELHKSFGCELRDPNGTIWEHAASLQRELDALRKDANRYRWLRAEVCQVPTYGTDFIPADEDNPVQLWIANSCGDKDSSIDAAIDAAIKPEDGSDG